MNTADYLLKLEQELRGLDQYDQQNALAYYSEYLLDAEATGKTDAVDILGSPRSLAAQIRADIAMDGAVQPQSQAQSQPGPQPQSQSDLQPQSGPRPQPQPGPQPQPPSGQWAGGAQATGQAQLQRKSRKQGLGTVWTVVLAILAIPLGVPLAIVLFALIIAVLAVLFAALVTMIAVVVALLVYGLVCSAGGLVLLFTHLATGLFYSGVGLVSLALCVLLAIAFLKLGRLCITGVARFFNAIRKRLQNRERGIK
ncbi:MAG: DUF1700 domain-containing protein [Coriobacteriales bacterium]|jgi:uncharacterized membrane protein|nr:DUF1700 domain-containing protein [Coriobacteriales bacterium]